MTFNKDARMNPIIKAAGLSWATAQIVKIIAGLIRYGRKDRARTVWRVIWAGGMPSAHSALITSSVLTIFLTMGAKSPLFGLALIMACIVIYDRSRAFAIYRTFQDRYPMLKQAVQNEPILIDLVGHRLSEVLVGVLIGLGCGLLVDWL
jgi:acid phosphatase family membrane protein YuiD